MSIYIYIYMCVCTAPSFKKLTIKRRSTFLYQNRLNFAINKYWARTNNLSPVRLGLKTPLMG